MDRSAPDPTSPSLLLVRPGVPPAAFRAATGPDGWPLAVARAIVSSPAWRELGHASLVVRTDPAPIFGILGRFDARAERRIQGLALQLTEQLPHLAYWSYPTVEAATQQLADLVRMTIRRLDAVEVRYRAVPRGGHVILGMLAYLLNADPDQLERPVGPQDTVIVVDDVAISGSRLTRFLDEHPTWPHVVVATLAAPMELAAVFENESRVRAFLAARELTELPPPLAHRDDVEAWRRRWRERRGDDVRWVGRTEHLAFPWNEPDFATWSDATDQVERGWSLVPPELCMKHRGRLADTGSELPNGSFGDIQCTPELATSRELEPRADVIAGRLDDTVVVGATCWDRCIALDGVAATVWHAIVRRGTAAAAIEAVTASYDVDPATARRDAVSLIDGLIEVGAIVPSTTDAETRAP